MVNYFRRFLGKQNLCGTIDSLVAQRLGPVEVLSGVYTFRWVERGRAQSARARYTFVTAPTRRGLKIVTHHSSQLPGRQAQ
jgi:hypothetical protein